MEAGLGLAAVLDALLTPTLEWLVEKVIRVPRVESPCFHGYLPWLPKQHAGFDFWALFIPDWSHLGDPHTFLQSAIILVELFYALRSYEIPSLGIQQRPSAQVAPPPWPASCIVHYV